MDALRAALSELMLLDLGRAMYFLGNVAALVAPSIPLLCLGLLRYKSIPHPLSTWEQRPVLRFPSARRRHVWLALDASTRRLTEMRRFFFRETWTEMHGFWRGGLGTSRTYVAIHTENGKSRV